MKLLRAAVLGALGCAAYAVAEARLYRLQRHRLTMRAGIPALNVLHISDTHLRAADRGRLEFLRSLPERIGIPDLVLATGDLVDNDSGIDPVLDALEGFPARLGRFYVLGSHDYFQTRFKLPIKYFFTKDPEFEKLAPADTPRFEKGLQDQGWICLTNTAHVVDTDLGRLRVTGVDDPYMNRHRTDHIKRAADDALAIGLAHSPDVVSDYALHEYDLIVCGHTHGGQVRAPLVGAIVTNSSIPCELAMGPNLVGDTWLHVSPGLGVSPNTPIRFLCRPEITMLELRPSP